MCCCRLSAADFPRRARHESASAIDVPEPADLHVCKPRTKPPASVMPDGAGGEVAGPAVQQIARRTLAVASTLPALRGTANEPHKVHKVSSTGLTDLQPRYEHVACFGIA